MQLIHTEYILFMQSWIGLSVYVSQSGHEVRLPVAILAVVLDSRLERYQAVLATNVEHVVYPPVDLPDPSGRVPEPLNDVKQDYTWA